MADDVAITAGVGTAIATDEVAARHYQLVKPAFGIDGAAALVSGAAPFPVQPGLKLTEQLTRAVVSFAGAGDNIVIAANATKFNRIFAILLFVDSAVSIKLGEGGPTYWTGAMRITNGFFLSQQGEPHFVTSAINKSFLINLSAAVQCSGVVWYEQSA